MALITPVTVTTAITPIIPPGPRTGYRLTVKSGSGPVAFVYGDKQDDLTFAKGDEVGVGQTVVMTDERIVKYGVKAIVQSGTATVSAEIFV